MHAGLQRDAEISDIAGINRRQLLARNGRPSVGNGQHAHWESVFEAAVQRTVACRDPITREVRVRLVSSRRELREKWTPAHPTKLRPPMICRHGCRRKEPLRSDQRSGRDTGRRSARFDESWQGQRRSSRR